MYITSFNSMVNSSCNLGLAGFQNFSLVGKTFTLDSLTILTGSLRSENTKSAATDMNTRVSEK